MYFFWKWHRCWVRPLRQSGIKLSSTSGSGNVLALNKSCAGLVLKRDIPPFFKMHYSSGSLGPFGTNWNSDGGMSHKTCSWTYALSRFYSYDKLIYSSYIPFQPLLHMMRTWKGLLKLQPSAHTSGWHVWLETADTMSGFTKTERTCWERGMRRRKLDAVTKQC